MNWLRDAVERTLATYVQALAGLLIAGWSDMVDVGTLRAAAVAAIPAGLAVLKAAIARRFGDPESAALIGEYDAHVPED